MPYRSGFTHFILVLRINQSVRFPVNEEFTNMHDLKIHQCPECDFKVTRKENVKLHILRVHKREFNFQCFQCPKQYPIKSELNSHIQSKHNERNLECPNCDKKFSVQRVIIAWFGSSSSFSTRKGKSLKPHGLVFASAKQPFRC